MSNDCAGITIRGKQGHKQLAPTLVSVYHPCTKTGKDKLYLRFLKTLNNLLGRAPAKLEIVMEADVNSSLESATGYTPQSFAQRSGHMASLARLAITE